jgi:hypothetical protein
MNSNEAAQAVPAPVPSNEGAGGFRLFFGVVLGAVTLYWADPISFLFGWAPIVILLGICGVMIATGIWAMGSDAAATSTSPAAPTVPFQLSPEAQRRWFWITIFLGITLIAFANSVNDDVIAGLLSAATIAAGAVMLHFVAKVNVVEHAWKTGWKTVLYVVAYLAIGIGFSLFRWDYHVYDWRQGYDNAKVRYESSSSQLTPDGDVPVAWTDSSARRYLIQTMPEFENSKALLTRWVVFWPWSATYFFLSDLVVRGLDWLVTQFSGVYDWISSRYTSDLH